ISDADSIVLRESLKEVDALMQQAIPGISPFVFKRRVAESAPFLKQCCATVVSREIGHESLFKTAAKGHGRASFFFLPAVQIAVAITARAAQVLADLRVAIDHRCLPAHRCEPAMCSRGVPSLLRGRKLLDSDRSARLDLCRKFE